MWLLGATGATECLLLWDPPQSDRRQTEGYLCSCLLMQSSSEMLQGQHSWASPCSGMVKLLGGDGVPGALVLVLAAKGRPAAGEGTGGDTWGRGWVETACCRSSADAPVASGLKMALSSSTIQPFWATQALEGAKLGVGGEGGGAVHGTGASAIEVGIGCALK